MRIFAQLKNPQFRRFWEEKNLRHKVSRKCLILQNLRKKRFFGEFEEFQSLHTNRGGVWGYFEISEYCWYRWICQNDPTVFWLCCVLKELELDLGLKVYNIRWSIYWIRQNLGRAQYSQFFISPGSDIFPSARFRI